MQALWACCFFCSFSEKAGRILDLYQDVGEGVPSGPNDRMPPAGEKGSIQARPGKHDSLPPQPGRGRHLEHEYKRRGSPAYLGAWDVRRAEVFGRCEAKTTVAAFGRLVAEVVWIRTFGSFFQSFGVCPRPIVVSPLSSTPSCWPGTCKIEIRGVCASEALEYPSRPGGPDRHQRSFRCRRKSFPPETPHLNRSNTS